MFFITRTEGLSEAKAKVEETVTHLRITIENKQLLITLVTTSRTLRSIV